MIIRELKKDPDKYLKNFDWFNNYKDTRNWAKFDFPSIIPRLDEGYQKYKDGEHLKHYIKHLRPIMKRMSGDKRIELIETLMEDYCVYCGSEYLPCHCNKDE